jgi:hypothetical protein
MQKNKPKQIKVRIPVSQSPAKIETPKVVNRKGKPIDDGPPVYLDDAPVVLGSEEDESAVDLMVGAPDVIEENAFLRSGYDVSQLKNIF